ncbi:MAG: tetratricopeptide repeat protein [Pseudomonadota bacterium]
MPPRLMPRLIRSIALFTCVLVLVVGVGPAAAQETVPPETMRKARAHYKQGKAFHDEGAYDLAIEEYVLAYQLARLPELLFNIAQAYRLKGDTRKAVEYYRRYLEQEPEGRGSDQARIYIAKILKQASPDSVQDARPDDRAEEQGQEGVSSSLGAAFAGSDQPATNATTGAATTATAAATVAAGRTGSGASETEVDRPATGSRLAALLRIDADPINRGAVLSGGASYRAGSRFELSLTAILNGEYLGVFPAVTFDPWLFSLKPLLIVSAPVMLVEDSVRPGISSAIGGQWDLSPHFEIFLQAGAMYVPNMPASRDTAADSAVDGTIMILSLGLKGRL